MGTDIHLSAEIAVFDEEGRQTGWEWLPGPITNCWSCQGTGERTHNGETKPCYWCSHEFYDEYEDEPPERNMRYVPEVGKVREGWYHDRNYLVFACLADVRNGYGFAGVKTFDPVTPISKPRGVPEDATEESLAVLSNEHSASWLMLDEVLAYEWGQPIRQSGVLSLKQYAEAIRLGRPQEWCGDISGGSIRKVSLDEANQMLAEGLDDPNVYVAMEWEDRMADGTENFVKAMQVLAMTAGEVPVRLVFDFDS